MLLEYLGDKATEDYRVFNETSDKVFIGQFVSKREGIDLKTADAIVCLNIDFAYLSYIQMINRMMAYDRTKKPVLIWLWTRGGIEEKVYKVVTNKHNFTKAYYTGKMRIKEQQEIEL
jgi:hypothetical protein